MSDFQKERRSGRSPWEHYQDWKRYANGDHDRDEERPEGGMREAGGLITTSPDGAPRNSGLVLAIVLITLGILFFLSNLGVFHIHDVFSYWPVILIVLGLSKMAKAQALPGNVQGAAYIALGGALLLSNLGLFSFSPHALWPLALVGVGTVMLFRAIGFKEGAADNSEGENSIGSDPDSVLHEWAVFGGVKRRVDTPDFQGGRLTATFGGIEIDLRNAQIVPRGRPVILDVNAAFGGLSISVPDTWRISVRGVAICGAYEDKTLRARRSDSSAPLLIITGYAAFGGVVIE